ncbi:Gfo/Idh/MocA family protein [Jonesia denitrificans]|uniref:Oxidoreductase domain protein n=1 Tax=Jonesia denitrificans (strain ATCC 14870 / DSM 20603 / BCRC 15368 / CIP 55.134 / JCM 11481 / NBRC 15587 / NCTC 10816 / Prevot 55134) TaxID=471856 RepID=C7R1J8_JONDD|nr:Gfo/Idh/MocA family oxidoreductase [Jonesia denitrificans]ACV09833.1 oxidoreductase domain protein [Jonesia denitrificans DSM 20603]ASE08970.1 gfo/Idh/MocA family oxidoreductase [Jonesia denitrificans]QXB43515.1 Gfo/Idh/MocA family oxidoreductase [Jonesia denitrificans]SQH22484.1 1,5-anhydro-D-fructose reductase [Jonesia denitrificans]
MRHITIPSALTTGVAPRPQDAPAIRWGILGAGWISESFAQAVTERTASTIAAVASRDSAKAQTFIDSHLPKDSPATAYGSYEELVGDESLDAIYIGTPHSHHRDHALLAIRAGKHVLVEKAFTRNAAEAREVFDAAKEAGVFVLEAMWTRFLPHIAQVRHILESRVLGDIIVVSADHGQAFTVGPEHRLLNPDLAGGALLDLGVYPIAFAHDLLGHPEAITARGVLTDTGVDGQVSMIFDYPGRTQALLHTTQWGQTPTVASIVGTKGRIDIAEAFYRPTSFVHTTYGVSTATYEQDDVLGLEFEAAEVARCVSEGRTASDRMPWQSSIEVMEIMDEVRAQIGVRYPNE